VDYDITLDRADVVHLTLPDGRSLDIHLTVEIDRDRNPTGAYEVDMSCYHRDVLSDDVEVQFSWERGAADSPTGGEGRVERLPIDPAALGFDVTISVTKPPPR
jgi:hypothetical protein